MKPRKQSISNDAKRHDKFTGGKDRDPKIPFEHQLLAQEKWEREKVRLKQVLGMQGRDGGRCWDKEVDSGIIPL